MPVLKSGARRIGDALVGHPVGLCVAARAVSAAGAAHFHPDHREAERGPLRNACLRVEIRLVHVQAGKINLAEVGDVDHVPIGVPGIGTLRLVDQ